MNKKIPNFIILMITGLIVFFLTYMVEDVFFRIMALFLVLFSLIIFNLTKKKMEAIVVDVPTKPISSPENNYISMKEAKKFIMRRKPIQWKFVILTTVVGFFILSFLFILRQSSLQATSQVILENLPIENEVLKAPTVEMMRAPLSVGIEVGITTTRVIIDLVVEIIQKVSGSVMTAGGAILMVRELKKKKETGKKRRVRST